MTGCEGECKLWFHCSCVGINEERFKALVSDGSSTWMCENCNNIKYIRESLSDSIQLQPQLPAFEETCQPISAACWGKLRGLEIVDQVNAAYETVVKWKKNLFQVPTGKVGKLFVEELTKAITNFTSSSALEEVALTMVMVLPALLLQKPSRRSKTKDHIAYLDKRLKWWQDGELDLLVREGVAIQDKLLKSKMSADHCEKVFVRLMLQGKISAAMRWIGSQSTTVLPVDDTVMAELDRLHPTASAAEAGSILQGPANKVESVIFENIDGDLIRQCAKRTEGSAGPSGLDSDGWKRILCSKQFGSKPEELCDSIAELARKLCSTSINPKLIKSFTACRLVPLSKPVNSVRPVGIGEVLRRIIGKAIMQVLNPELVNATAPLQVCSGLPGGVEAAVHALRRVYEDDDTEAIIMVDAENAFNCMNRTVALNNMKYICPEIATYLTNTYREPAVLYVSGSDDTLLSEEGVTQGDNTATGNYACSLMPLLRGLIPEKKKKEEKDSEPGKEEAYKKLIQTWFADDAAAGGTLNDIQKWWSILCETGPLFGYHPKPSKSWIIVKPKYRDKAKSMFPNLDITDIGHKYLGSYIGNEEGTADFMQHKLSEWMEDIVELSNIAIREPQVAYAAFIYGLSKRWNDVCRTTPGISSQLKKLEFKIRESFIPALLDRVFSCTDMCRRIFALPAREGGLGIHDISETADNEYQYSRRATEKLTEAIYNQELEYSIDVEEQRKVKSDISKERVLFYKKKRSEIVEELNELEKLQLDLASEKGASTWLTALPLKSFGYLLNKQEFTDAICLRYNLKIKDTAKVCVCGDINTLNHSLICKKGGYVSMRHNSLVDVIAKMLSSAGCKDVETEPVLLPTAGTILPSGSNTSDNARADVSARSVWNPLEKAFFDVRVYHAQAPSNRNLKTIPNMYRHHEELKKRAYNARVIEVEKGVFTPVVFSTSGGMGNEAKNLFKRIAEKMAAKTGQRYSETITFIRKRIRFDLLKTTVIALRGHRGKHPVPETEDISKLDINISPRV